MRKCNFFRVSTAICAVMFGFLLFSCKEQNNGLPENIAKNEVISDYKIPVNLALADLRTMFNALDVENNNQEKFSSRVFRDNVKAISRLQTNFQPSIMKSVKEETAPLLYIVDFEDNKGWAILSADYRVEPTVLAVIERGNYSDFENEYLKKDITDDLKDAQLYNKEYDEYAVAGVIDLPKNEKVLSFCYQYARNEIDNFNKGYYKGGIIFIDYDSIVAVEYSVKEHIPPLLKTLWGQSAPYNNNCPTHTTCGTSNGKAWAGCVTIALAQIMTYNNWPSPVPGLYDRNASGQFYSDWSDMPYEYQYSWMYGMTRFELFDNINPEETPTPNNTDEIYLAKFIRQIFDDVIWLYGKNGSFGFPSTAARALQNYYHYNNVNRYNVTSNTDIDTKIRNMLLNNKPVFFSAISNIVNGHAWVIDGFKKVEVEYIRYLNGEQVRLDGTPAATPPERNYLHCNWGWYGKCNGYFVSKIFDLRNGPSSIDAAYGDINDTENLNFNWGGVMITYDVPTPIFL